MKNNYITNKIILDMMRDRFNGIDKKLDGVGNRLTVIEIWKANLMGKFTIIVGCASLVFTVVWGYVENRFRK